MNEFLAKGQPYALSLLRFMVGFLIFWHGSQKLFAFPPSEMVGGELNAIVLTAGILEFGGGLLLIFGLFTRWTAFILSGLMAVAYWMAHGLSAFLPIVNRGELAAVYCFVFLYLFFAGGGKVSLDNLFKK
ncbi:MAG: DoxX family protein [Pyrinomonadaceae bacterium]